MLDDGIDPPSRSRSSRRPGRRAAVIGSGPAGMAAAYYLLIAGHDVTVFERDPAPGGMLRYGIPQYRLPKVEVLEAEYESVTRLGGKIVCNQGLGRDFTLDDLQNQGFDAVLIAIGCYDTNKLGIPGEDADGVIDGLEYLRTATLGLEYPGHKGKRVVVIGGGFTSMDCTRTSVRQGAAEVTLVYRRDMKDMPASNEVHEAIEEGVTAIFQAGPVRVITDADNKVTGVEFIRMKLGEPDASGRRRPEPAPGTEFTIPCDRVLLAIGQGPDLTWIGPGSEGPEADQAAPPQGRRGHVRDRPAGRLRHRRRPDRRGDRRPGHRRGPPRRVRRRRLPQGPRPRRDPDPPDAGRAAARVPLDRAVHERGQGAALPHEGDGGRGPQPELRRVRDPVHAGQAVAESTRCLQCTCEAIGFCDLRRLGIEYGTTLKTLEPQYHPGAGYRSVTENRFTGVNHDYIRDDSHAFILREPSRCIDCGRCAQVCSEVVGAACYDFMRIGFDTLVTTPLDMSLNDTPCVSCGRCAETCPTGALMPKPRVLQKYDVDESRCILCGICVDACPVRRPPRRRRVRARPRVARGPDDRPAGLFRGQPGDRGHLHPPRARLGGAGDGRGPAARPAGCCRCCRPRSRGRQRGNGHGNGNGHAHDTTRRRRRGRGPSRARALGPAGGGAIGRRRRGEEEARRGDPSTVPFIGLSWDDVLFLLFAATMIGTALLVVTMRDIIRCGLAMMVCFGALAGIYVLLGAPLVAAAQVLVYIGGDQRPHPVRDHAHPDQVGARPGSSSRRRRSRPRSPRSSWRSSSRSPSPPRTGARSRRASRPTDGHARAAALPRLRPAVRDRERPAAGRGHRRRVPRQARGGRPAK